jgi:hypothetical protein
MGENVMLAGRRINETWTIKNIGIVSMGYKNLLTVVFVILYCPGKR